MTRIALIAGTLTGNQGAEAMLSAAIGRIAEARPDARFTVLSYYPKADRALARADIEVLSATPAALVLRHLPGALVARLLPRRLRPATRFLPAEVRRIAEAEVLVDLAGVSFIDGREKFLPFNILTLFAAIVLGTPVVKLSQAIGPCRGRLTRLAARLVLPRCARVFARGERTVAHLAALKLANIEPAPDLAFLLRDGDRLAARPPDGADAPVAWLAAERAGGRPVVGICPSALVFQQLGHGYAALVAETVGRLLARGVSVLLFPNATRADAAQLRNNDLAAIAAVREALGPIEDGDAGHLFILDRRTDALEVKAMIAGLDLAVVSRFHAMIGALSSSTPTVVLGWGHKYHEVMAAFGLEDLVLDAAAAVNGGADALEAAVVDALDRGPALAAAIRTRLPAVETAAAAQIAYLCGLLHPAPVAASTGDRSPDALPADRPATADAA